MKQINKIMSGLKNYGEGGIYLGISEGKLIRQHKQPIDGRTTSRVNKNGKTVHEEKFDYLEGTIQGLKVNVNDFGKTWAVKIVDDEKNIFYVNIMYSSRYSTSFLKCLPNIKLDQPVRLMPWSRIDEKDATRTVTGITMWQGKVKIEPHFTKEHPNGLPQMKQVRFKGKDAWDSEEMDAFLEKTALAMFEPMPETEASEVINTGDLPF